MTPLRHPIWIVVLAGLATRVAWWAYAGPFPVSDFEYYRRLGEGLLSHGQLGVPNPIGGRVPGYPVFLAALMLIDRSIGWLSLGNALASAALPYLVYLLARRLSLTPRATLVAAIVTAFNPTLVLFAPVLASEHLYVLLLFGALVALCPIAPAPLRPRRAAVAGLIAGGAILTRPDGVFYLPLLLAIAAGWLNRSSSTVRTAGAFLLAMCLVVAPWYVRNRVVIGPGVGLSTTGGLNFYYAHNDVAYGWHPLQGTALEGLGGRALHQRAQELGIEFIANAPVSRLLADVALGTRRLFDASDNYGEFWSTREPGVNPDVFTANALGNRRAFSGGVWLYNVLLFAAAAASLLFARRYPPRTSLVLYGMVVVTWLGYAVVFWAMARYRYAIEGVLAIMAAMTWERIRTLGAWRPRP